MSALDYPYTAEIMTRCKDNDVYGHINNVECYAYFDNVINDYLVCKGGLDIQGAETIGVCVESGCRFLASLAYLAYPARLRVGLMVTRLGRSSARYELGVFDEGGNEPVAQGFFVQVFVDRNDRRPKPIPPALRDALTRLQTTPQWRPAAL